MLNDILHRIKLLFAKDRELYLRYKRMLGFYPRRLDLYQQAVLHRSTAIRAGGHLLNNERLEFLGDAILDAIVADILFCRYPNKQEGFLTNTRSKVVQRETLNKLAFDIGLDKLIRYANHSPYHNSYMYGNSFEALIGAIYLDQGYDKCRQFMLNRIIDHYIDLDKLSRKETNHKSKLIEWCQKMKVEPEFKLIGQRYDDHSSPIFDSEILIEGVSVGKGNGYSKKESQQMAAQIAYSAVQRAKTQQAIFARRNKRQNACQSAETDPHSPTLNN